MEYVEHNRYKMIYDGGHFVDGIEFENFEDAKHDAIETLISWIVDEVYYWNFDENHMPHLTERQIEMWDTMINDCCVYVVEWNEEKNDYDDMDDAWFPSYEDENEIGWMEWDKLKAKHGW